MKIALFGLVIALLIMPHFGYAESPDNKGADEEYMLLLKFELETTPASLPAAAQDKESERGQDKKIIITIIPDP